MDPNVTDLKIMPSALQDLNSIGPENPLYKEIVYRCTLLKKDPLPEESGAVVCCQKQDYDIYKLKRVTMGAYRALYTIDEGRNRIVILGIMHRSINYEGEYMERIIHDYIDYFGGDAHVTK